MLDQACRLLGPAAGGLLHRLQRLGVGGALLGQLLWCEGVALGQPLQGEHTPSGATQVLGYVTPAASSPSNDGAGLHSWFWHHLVC